MFRKKLDWNNPDDIIAHLAGLNDSTEWLKFTESESQKNITLLIERINTITIPKILAEEISIDKNAKFEDICKKRENNYNVHRAAAILNELVVFLALAQLKKEIKTHDQDHKATCTELAEAKKELAALKAKLAGQENAAPRLKP